MRLGPFRTGSIGPAGVAARAIVGLGLVALEVLWRDPKWWDPLVAVGMAAAVTAFMTIRAARRPAPLDATGRLAHALNVVLAVPLLLLPLTSGGALLFYGGSMLLAAARRNCGCEVTVIPNAILGRRDELGCALFAPVDMLEGALRSEGDSDAADLEDACADACRSAAEGDLGPMLAMLDRDVVWLDADGRPRERGRGPTMTLARSRQQAGALDEMRLESWERVGDHVVVAAALDREQRSRSFLLTLQDRRIVKVEDCRSPDAARARLTDAAGQAAPGDR